VIIDVIESNLDSISHRWSTRNNYWWPSRRVQWSNCDYSILLKFVLYQRRRIAHKSKLEMIKNLQLRKRPLRMFLKLRWLLSW